MGNVSCVRLGLVLTRVPVNGEWLMRSPRIVALAIVKAKGMFVNPNSLGKTCLGPTPLPILRASERFEAG